MNRELTFFNPLSFTGFLDQLFGQGRRFCRRDHPADPIAAKDVQDDIEVKVAPLYKLRYILHSLDTGGRCKYDDYFMV